MNRVFHRNFRIRSAGVKKADERFRKSRNKAEEAERRVREAEKRADEAERRAVELARQLGKCMVVPLVKRS